MFRINSSRNKKILHSWLVLVLLHISQSQINCDDDAEAPAKELCPCLPRTICPRVYGMSPEDEFYLGVILKCADPDYVRCCGVSVESVVGGRLTMSTTTKAAASEEIVPPQETTTGFALNDLEFTTISNEIDANTESNGEIQLQTNYDNGVATELINDVTESVTDPSVVTESDQIMVFDVATKMDEDAKLNEFDGERTLDEITTEPSEQYTTTSTFVDDDAKESRSVDENVFSVFPSEKYEDPNEEKYIAGPVGNVIYPVMEVHAEDSEMVTTEAAAQNYEQSSEINEMTTIDEAVTSQSNDENIKSNEIEAASEESVESVRSNEIIGDEFEMPTTEKSFDDPITTSEPMIEATTLLPNVIATTVAEADVTFPDLISTIEAVHPTKRRQNKRRNSNFRSRQSVSTTTSVPTTSPLQSENSENASVKTVANKYAKRREFVRHRNTKPDITTSPLGNGLKMALDDEHKETISNVHSLLSTIAKQPTQKRPINQSKSLQQLMSYEKSLFKSSLGHRHNYGKKASEPEAPADEVETTTPTEKQKTKYNRRLPVKEFNLSSSKSKTITTTTTTEEPVRNESNKESATTRYRFSKRRQYSPKVENESTTSESNLVTKPNESLQNKPIDAQAALERRKKLFATRNRGGWSKAEKPIIDASTIENVTQTTETST